MKLRKDCCVARRVDAELERPHASSARAANHSTQTSFRSTGEAIVSEIETEAGAALVHAHTTLEEKRNRFLTHLDEQRGLPPPFRLAEKHLEKTAAIARRCVNAAKGDEVLASLAVCNKTGLARQLEALIA
jgi:hypothetical protein